MALNLGTLVGYLRIDDSQYNRTLDKADSKGSGWASGMGKYGKLAAAGFGTASAGAVIFGVKTAAANEQARISFTTMLGSAEKADTFLRQLHQFEQATPFEFPELQEAASSLVSVGIKAKDIIPIMTSVGDAVAGSGKGAEGVKRATVALQQMNAAGRITAEDLNQLRDAGIPVYDLLAAATGKSREEVARLAQTGKLGKKELDQLMEALKSGKGLERFSGLMDKQSQSLAGMWSSFKSTFGTKMADVIAPLIPLMKDGLGGATIAVSAAAKYLPPIFTKVGAAIGTVIGIIQTLVGFVEDNQTTFKVLAGIITAVLLPAIITWGVQSTIAGAKSVAAWLLSKAQAVSSALFQVAWLTAVAVGWVALGVKALAGAARTAAAWLLSKAQAAGAAIAQVASLALVGAKWIWGGIQAMLGAARMAAAWLIAMGPIGIAIALIAGVVVLIVKHWDTIKAKTKAAWDWVVAQVKKIPGLLVSFFMNFTLPGLIIKHWDKIKSTVKAGAAAVVDYVKALPGKILSAVGKLGTLLVDAGKDLMRGLRDGISAGLKWVRDKVAGLGSFIPGWVKSALGISSPSKVMRDQVGIWIPAGVAEGITRGIPQVEAAARRMSVASSVPQNRIGMTRFGSGASGAADAGASGAGATVQQTIYAHEGQSAKEVGDWSAERVLFALGQTGGPR